MKNGELMEKIKKNDDFYGGPKTSLFDTTWELTKFKQKQRDFNSCTRSIYLKALCCDMDLGTNFLPLWQVDANDICRYVYIYIIYIYILYIYLYHQTTI